MPFDFDRASSATRVNKDGLIETVGSGEPRIDFSNDSKGALKLEPSRTNLITYSEDFTQWSKNSGGIVVTDNTTDVISPSGSTNASKVDFGSSNRIIFQSPTLSGVYSGSVYVKGIAGETIRFSVGAVEENFTLTGGWDRILKENITASANTFNLNTYGGVTARTIYVWGAQLEQGSYATSYIPTQGSAVTRVAESCEQTVPDGIINSSEGVLFAEFEIPDLSTSLAYPISIYGTGAAIQIYYRPISQTISFLSSVGGVQYLYHSNINPLVMHKVALVYKNNEYSAFADGVLLDRQNSGIVPAPNTLNVLGLKDSGSSNFIGKVKDVKIYNTALTDQELISLTS